MENSITVQQIPVGNGLVWGFLLKKKGPLLIHNVIFSGIAETMMCYVAAILHVNYKAHRSLFSSMCCQPVSVQSVFTRCPVLHVVLLLLIVTSLCLTLCHLLFILETIPSFRKPTL